MRSNRIERASESHSRDDLNSSKINLLIDAVVHLEFQCSPSLPSMSLDVCICR
jgi:hypothetical protein